MFSRTRLDSSFTLRAPSSVILPRTTKVGIADFPFRDTSRQPRPAWASQPDSEVGILPIIFLARATSRRWRPAAFGGAAGEGSRMPRIASSKENPLNRTLDPTTLAQQPKALGHLAMHYRP